MSQFNDEEAGRQVPQGDESRGQVTRHDPAAREPEESQRAASADDAIESSEQEDSTAPTERVRRPFAPQDQRTWQQSEQSLPRYQPQPSEPYAQQPTAQASANTTQQQPQAQPQYGQYAPTRPQPQYGRYAPPQTEAQQPSAGAPGDGAGAPPQDHDNAVGFQDGDGGRRKRHLGAGATIAIAAVVAAAVGAGAGAGTYAALGGSSSQATTQSSNVTINNPDNVSEVTAVAAKASPSVVTITAASGQTTGTGSGVILDDQGHIVTNNHVVTLDGETQNAQLTVTLSNGQVYKASVVGLDPTMDLAVIKVDNAQGLTPATLGDSSKLNVGDLTVAIGAPQGLANTVTSGVVSALNRAIELQSSDAGNNSDGGSGGGYDFWNDFGGGQSQQQQQQSSSGSIFLTVIQTDASINPGNSGGPLVGSDGQIIGINVAIATASSSSSDSSSAGSIGLGFAIPVNVVKRITDELIQNGTATHGQLGATVRDATDSTQSTVSGAELVDVTQGGPAEQAGLKSGDVITAIDGVRVTGADHLIGTVRQAAPGTQFTLDYQRNGQSQQTTVTLGQSDS